MNKLFTLLFLTVFAATIPAQPGETPNFRTVVEKRLKSKFRTDLAKVCAIDSDPVANRVFRDYGAIFVSNNGGAAPANCILTNEAAVQAFQSAIAPQSANIGGITVTLQKAAMTEYLAARQEAAKKGLSISPRGGSTASARSYETTVDLWKSRFEPGLTYWTGQKKIARTEADEARKAPLQQQIAMVLAWEDQGIFFSKDLSKSILYSVAVPGASQHIFMLALDVEQFGDKRVRDILAKHGWFQTVKSDLPHFTYLGVSEKELPSLGFKAVVVSGQTFWIPNM